MFCRARYLNKQVIRYLRQMNGWQIFLIFFCGVALAQSIFLGTMMLAKDRFNRGALFYLGVMLLGLALRLIKSYFVFIPQPYPELGIIAGGAGLWVVGPAFYLYTRHSLMVPRARMYWQLVHFLPSFLILATATTRYVYYWGLLHFLVYFVISVLLARSCQSPRMPRHFLVFAKCTGMILLCFVVQASQGGIRVYTVGSGVAIVILYVINFLIVRDTGFLNSIIRKSKELDKKVVTRITADLTRFLFEGKIYRNRGLKLSELAKATNYPAYLISQSINQQYQMRFNEFLNKFRVQEAMERLKNSDENDKIEVIAREVGFSSMSSLYDAFKKETKVTPQIFRNQFNRP